MISPDIIKELVCPCYKAIGEFLKQQQMYFFIHSCGDVKEILPDLIDIGVNVFNPFQPEVMDVYEIRRKYGKNLCFYGGLSIQHTLPYGSPEEVKEESKKLIKEIGRGGGYILSPSHAIPKDVPLENILAAIETAQKQEEYGYKG